MSPLLRLQLAFIQFGLVSEAIEREYRAFRQAAELSATLDEWLEGAFPRNTQTYVALLYAAVIRLAMSEDFSIGGIHTYVDMVLADLREMLMRMKAERQ